MIRQILPRLTASVIILSGVLSASAETFTYSYEGQTLNYESIDENTCKLVKPDGNSVYSGQVTIPSHASSPTASYEVVMIGENAFANCSELTAVIIPDGVTTIGDFAFSGCGLTSITLPSSLTSIGGGAFAFCMGLNTVEIPGSVEEIGTSAFYNCAGLTTVTLPGSLISIGDQVFKGCNSLVSIIYYAENPIETSSNNFDNGIYYRATLYLLSEAIDRVSEIEPWKDFKKILPIDMSDATGYFEYTYEGQTVSYQVTDEEAKTCAVVTWQKGLNPSNDGILILPEYPNNGDEEYTLTEIRNWAFAGCTRLTSVDIPNTVTIIGDYAFKYCTDLTSVTIPNSVTSIGTEAFYYCTGLTSVSIPNSVNTIGACAFEYCTSLTSVIIPNSLRRIGYRTFADCTGLTDVIIPHSVTTVGNRAFCACSALTSITIPNSVTTIENAAFAESGLTTINIPNSVTTCKIAAFAECASLKEVTLPNSLTTLEDYVFQGCPLTSVKYPAENPIEAPSNVFENEVYANATLYLRDSAIESARSITPWSLFEKVEAIDESCDFEYTHEGQTVSYLIIDEDAKTCRAVKWKNLEEASSDATLILPENPKDGSIEYTLTEIGDFAFSGAGMSAVEIPNSVTIIGGGAFAFCSGLSTVTIPNSVTSIGTSAFNNCAGLTSVTLPGSLISIGDQVFKGCNSLVSIVYYTDTPVEGTYGIFEYVVYRRATLYLPPAAIEFAGDKEPWKNFRNIEAIGESGATSDFAYTYQGQTVFYHVTDEEAKTCAAVTWVNNSGSSNDGILVLPENPKNGDVEYTLTEFRPYAFANCTELTSVTIPGTVTTISAFAFNGCTGLTTVAIPNSVTKIGEWAFADSGLTTVTIPNSVTTIEYAVFLQCYNLCSVDIPSSVTEIGKQAFWFCSALSNITIPNSVTTIRRAAFTATGLTSVTIPNSVTTMEGAIFAYCDNLTEITLPDNLTKIGDGLLACCPSLTSITLPSTVTTIEEMAFQECKSLISINIPEGVTTIGYSVFEGCISLTNIDLPCALRTIGNRAFNRCTGLTTIDIPSSVESIEYRAFDRCSNLHTIKYYAENPIEAPSDVFDSEIYANATLYLPQVAIEPASSITPWSLFANVEVLDPESSIDTVRVEASDEPVEIYTLTGIRVGNNSSDLTPGIYIERRGNETRKIHIK